MLVATSSLRPAWMLVATCKHDITIIIKRTPPVDFYTIVTIINPNSINRVRRLPSYSLFIFFFFMIRKEGGAGRSTIFIT